MRVALAVVCAFCIHWVSAASIGSSAEGVADNDVKAKQLIDLNLLSGLLSTGGNSNANAFLGRSGFSQTGSGNGGLNVDVLENALSLGGHHGSNAGLGGFEQTGSGAGGLNVNALNDLLSVRATQARSNSNADARLLPSLLGLNVLGGALSTGGNENANAGFGGLGGGFTQTGSGAGGLNVNALNDLLSVRKLQSRSNANANARLGPLIGLGVADDLLSTGNNQNANVGLGGLGGGFAQAGSGAGGLNVNLLNDLLSVRGSPAHSNAESRLLPPLIDADVASNLLSTGSNQNANAGLGSGFTQMGSGAGGANVDALNDLLSVRATQARSNSNADARLLPSLLGVNVAGGLLSTGNNQNANAGVGGGLLGRQFTQTGSGAGGANVNLLNDLLSLSGRSNTNADSRQLIDLDVLGNLLSTGGNQNANAGIGRSLLGGSTQTGSGAGGLNVNALNDVLSLLGRSGNSNALAGRRWWGQTGSGAGGLNVNLLNDVLSGGDNYNSWGWGWGRSLPGPSIGDINSDAANGLGSNQHARAVRILSNPSVRAALARSSDSEKKDLLSAILGLLNLNKGIL